MYYVYLLKSLKDSNKTYVGWTVNLNSRLKKHNEGGSVYTAIDRPWKIITYLAFATETQAIAFEQYLKSQSGRAFAEKRLW